MKIDIKKWLLLILGTIAWSATMIKSGWNYSFGLGFWGPNGHDGVWHIALAESLARGSKEMPVFSGSSLQNYHLGFDFILALINKLTTLPINLLYFQIIPPILAFLVGYLTYKFVLLWRKSQVEALAATFFAYFGGSFGWAIGKGESAFWSQQAVSTLINPPFALSLVLLLAGGVVLINFRRNTGISNFILSVLFLGILVEIKIYAGVLVLGGLFLAGVYDFLKNKDKKIITVFVGAFFLSAVLFFTFNRSSTSLIVFQPFWFLETMMGLTDRVGWLRFFSAMTTYRTVGMWLKAIPAYALAFIIFLIGNAGTRILGFWHLKNIRRFSWVEIFLLMIIVFGTILPMLFLQMGTSWNTIQFFYYSLFFLGILAGVSIGQFSENPKLKTIMIYIMIVGLAGLTLPTTIETLSHVYLPGRPPAMLPSDEVRALTFLSHEPEGVVLTYPFDRAAAKEAEANPPRPLYLYESSAYVSAYSDKQTFLEDEVNLDITGYDWKERRNEVEAFYRESDQTRARNFLTENNIRYIYWVKNQRAYLGESQLHLNKIFENKTVDIYEFTGE